MTRTDEASSSPDWVVNLDQPTRPPKTDPRLDDVRSTLAGMRSHAGAIETSCEAVETLLRDCAKNGMTEDEIAVQATLPIGVVVRVLSGGSLLH